MQTLAQILAGARPAQLSQGIAPMMPADQSLSGGGFMGSGFSADAYGKLFPFSEGQMIPNGVQQRGDAFAPEMPSMNLRDQGIGPESDLLRALYSLRPDTRSL